MNEWVSVAQGETIAWMYIDLPKFLKEQKYEIIC